MWIHRQGPRWRLGEGVKEKTFQVMYRLRSLLPVTSEPITIYLVVLFCFFCFFLFFLFFLVVVYRPLNVVGNYHGPVHLG